MAELDRISFCKVEDLVVVDEVTWGALIESYLELHPDLRGNVKYDDPEFIGKAMGLLQLMYGNVEGEA